MLTNRIQTFKKKINLHYKNIKTRNSPPLPANDYCNQTEKKGNDGNMYISKPNKK